MAVTDAHARGEPSKLHLNVERYLGPGEELALPADASEVAILMVCDGTTRVSYNTYSPSPPWPSVPPESGEMTGKDGGTSIQWILPAVPQRLHGPLEEAAGNPDVDWYG